MASRKSLSPHYRAFALFFARNSSFTYRGRNVDVRTKWAAPIADQPLPSTSPPRVIITVPRTS